MTDNSSDFTIRPATFEDIGDILIINQLTWDISYQGCLPDELLQERHRTFATRLQKWQQHWQEKVGFVAEINGKIVGETTGCLQGTIEGFDCILNTLYVNPQYQGLSIGKTLFFKFADEMKNHDKHKMEIHTMYKGVPDKNGYAKPGPSIGFYQKMGCILTETYDTHPLGMTDVLMIKEL